MEENISSLAETTWANLSSAMASVKLIQDLRWANPPDIKKSIEFAFTAAFGSKEEYNKASIAAAKASKQQNKHVASKPVESSGSAEDSVNAEASTSAAPVSVTNMFEEGFLAKLHPVGGNPQLSEHLREEHMKATGGFAHTRFPPEPNGTRNALVESRYSSNAVHFPSKVIYILDTPKLSL